MVGSTILGVFIGALPGLNPVKAIALLLPLTYSMDPLVARGMVAGIYDGSMYGGAIPAILLRIPAHPPRSRPSSTAIRWRKMATRPKRCASLAGPPLWAASPSPSPSR
jgi:TctA family transporter